ncbi:LPXTG cell wall anchor domain-containing protein [Halobacillus sp. MO56]
MKNINKISLFCLGFLIFFGSFLLTALPTLASDDDSIEVNVGGIFPDRLLFNSSKLAPGRTVSQEIIVNNTKDFNLKYTVTSNYKNGSKQLYNILTCKVFDEKGNELFKGKLSEFELNEQRNLKKSTADKLTFEVALGKEAGNEYQGLKTLFQINFVFKGKAPEKPKTGEPSTPSDKDDGGGQGIPTTGDDSGTPQTGTATPAFSGGLPQTGESMPTMFYLIGGLLVAFGFALYASVQVKRRE